MHEITGKKIALGMSGGVDSSVAAHLLKEQGYEVTGVYLECWRAPGCRTEEDRADALKVALSLDIPFQVLDFKQTYKDKVVEYFFDEYQDGRTPNPDVMCNREIKFGLFYDWAMEQGFDYVATGHYAQVIEDAAGFHLAAAADDHKDQTYFLYLLRKEQLAHIKFPIGHLTKPQVREAARERGLHVATKKDSVGICFIGDINVHEFLKDRLGENPGNVVDVQGNVIGRHKGLWFYTIGQRHGFTLNGQALIKKADGTTLNKHIIPPFYVVAKNGQRNELVVGFGAETFRQAFQVESSHWLENTTDQMNLQVRIRHTGELLACEVTRAGHNWLVQLAHAVKGIADGQSAVFYKDGILWGGGVIAQ